MKPLFSIIIPTYNRSQMLKNAIQSVLNQTFDNWELIVVDDGSTDDTKSTVNSFSDERIRYIYQENQERSAARNNGINQANGDMICFLDSDDEYLPHHLQSFHEAIGDKHNDTNKLLYTGCSYEQSQLFTKLNNHFERFLLFPVSPPRVCISKPLLDKHQFDPSISLSEDTELWLRILTESPEVLINPSTTVNIIDHEGRSIRHKEQQQYESNIEFAQQMQSLYPEYISKQALGFHMSNLLVTLATKTVDDRPSYARNQIIQSIKVKPFHRLKEKLFVLVKSLGLKK